MATTCNPCLPVSARAPGVPVSINARRELRIKCRFSVSSSTGELFAGDGRLFTLGSSRRVQQRSLKLETSEQQHWSRVGLSARNALLDETRSRVQEETQSPEIAFCEDEESLKRKAAQLVQPLEGTCIYLVGMMGSGKSTVGRGLSEALGYSFFDSDKLVEQAWGASVSEMFRAGREQDFRNAEEDAIEWLCRLTHLVVATGGGAVIRHKNWDSMRHGITAWLDVPVEVLARRVVAVGCHSRPLLDTSNDTSEDAAYKKALARLTSIFDERCDMYRKSDVVVSLKDIAGARGIEIEAITPTMIAIEVLDEIAEKLEREGRVS
ncbi:hypothetical protein R1sor_008571 [Riccia sorocarpa]|uniref:shikimate kinase n=1 Tax=Riccia sorocarpa TaxID=122646 RepID=A0ABD3HTT0_9MARC